MVAPPAVAIFLPPSWQQYVGKWLPLNAGTQIWATIPSGPDQFPAWMGLGVFAGCAAILLALGLLLFRRRDA